MPNPKNFIDSRHTFVAAHARRKRKPKTPIGLFVMVGIGVVASLFVVEHPAILILIALIGGIVFAVYMTRSYKHYRSEQIGKQYRRARRQDVDDERVEYLRSKRTRDER